MELNSNNFSDTIPSEIFDLELLVNFFVDDNPLLEGNLSPDVSKLVNLERFRLGRTNMGGALPPELFTVQTLKEFQIPQASFEGVLRDDQWLQLTQLQKVDLSFNKFAGPVPQELWRLDRLGTFCCCARLLECADSEGTVVESPVRQESDS